MMRKRKHFSRPISEADKSDRQRRLDREQEWRKGSSLFDQHIVPPHQPQSDTSVAAAHSVAHKTSARMEKVLRLIQQEPRTDQELFELLRHDPDDRGLRTLTTVESIRCALRDRGYVIDAGRRKRNPSGRRAILWEVNPTGVVKAKPVQRKVLEQRIEYALSLAKAHEYHGCACHEQPSPLASIVDALEGRTNVAG